MKLFASYPDVSFFRWKFARKERREGEKGRAPLLFLFPVVHCDSSPVTGVSRSPLCGKNTKHLRRRKISAHHLVLGRRDKNQYPVAEFYPSLFSLVTKSRNTPPPPPPPPSPKKKKRERKISTKDKLNKNKYICQLPFSRSYMSFLKYYAEKKGESDWCHELFQKSASGKASQVWQESGRNSLQSLRGACCFSKKREGWRGEKEKMPHLATRGGVLPFFLVHFADILIFK